MEARSLGVTRPEIVLHKKQPSAQPLNPSTPHPFYSYRNEMDGFILAVFTMR